MTIETERAKAEGTYAASATRTTSSSSTHVAIDRRMRMPPETKRSAERFDHMASHATAKLRTGGECSL
jgi:hypothetical protein